MYGITDVRALARQGKLAGGDEVKKRVLELPITLQDILDVAADNKEALEGNFGQQGYKMYGSAIQSAGVELEKDALGMGNTSAQVVAFDDEHSENELVYAITVSE